MRGNTGSHTLAQLEGQREAPLGISLQRLSPPEQQQTSSLQQPFIKTANNHHHEMRYIRSMKCFIMPSGRQENEVRDMRKAAEKLASSAQYEDNNISLTQLKREPRSEGLFIHGRGANFQGTKTSFRSGDGAKLPVG